MRCAGLPGKQRGSALLLVLVFMVVLTRMALSAVDSALLGTSLALNYRDHDRVFHTADALLTALDSVLMVRIRSEGLQVTLDTLMGAEVGIEMSVAAIEQSGVAVLTYHADAADFMPDVAADTSSTAAVCGLLYQLTVRASGVRPGTQIQLGLERQVCCDDAPGCEAGEFVSTRRQWRRLD